jgi:hypothetical protein
MLIYFLTYYWRKKKVVAENYFPINNNVTIVILRNINNYHFNNIIVFGHVRSDECNISTCFCSE